MPTADFARRLIAWHDRHGRHDLPWQRGRNPYRVWVSEIMLQQTQVATVVPYYERFMARFPSIAALATATLDEVLHLWTGLGYYARARNLHRAAQLLHREHAGAFPADIAAVVALPGVGRSTGAAILALANDQHHAILDGNVKRVLARYHAVEGAVDERTTRERLWELAELHTPEKRVATYTQAIMDLGATVCTRAKPRCGECPVRTQCRAFVEQRVATLPAPRRAKAARRTRHVWMLLARQVNGRVLLRQRPASGIWGGLWCLPEFESLEALRNYVGARLQIASERTQAPLESFRHSFTHYDLMITPCPVSCAGALPTVCEEGGIVWYDPGSPAQLGLPAPIKALIARNRPT
ncbi:MAG: A/G-specific adenine glycosylase [Pseudomonadales bacterium]|nr:A/G-specific adenine glycosylase [Pseudomonadales bacterium]